MEWKLVNPKSSYEWPERYRSLTESVRDAQKLGRINAVAVPSTYKYQYDEGLRCHINHY
jgi:hypothetical protein